MSGYTPLFSSLTTGTLCGRWPDIGLWPIVLSLADRHGIVDVTPQYLAGVTGLPVADVTACMKRFCEPDSYSRSAEQGGARLVLLDEHRDWGWRIVNHRMYREKARKSAFDAARGADGRNAERMQDRKADETRADPRKSDTTRADPPSDSNADSNSNAARNTSAAKPPTRSGPVLRKAVEEPAWWQQFRLRYPARAGDPNWRGAMKAANARIGEGHNPMEFLDGAERYAQFCQSAGKVGTEFVQQASTFLGPRKPFLLPWLPPAEPPNAMDEIMARAGRAPTATPRFDPTVIDHDDPFRISN